MDRTDSPERRIEQSCTVCDGGVGAFAVEAGDASCGLCGGDLGWRLVAGAETRRIENEAALESLRSREAQLGALLAEAESLGVIPEPVPLWPHDGWTDALREQLSQKRRQELTEYRRSQQDIITAINGLEVRQDIFDAFDDVKFLGNRSIELKCPMCGLPGEESQVGGEYCGTCDSDRLSWALTVPGSTYWFSLEQVRATLALESTLAGLLGRARTSGVSTGPIPAPLSQEWLDDLETEVARAETPAVPPPGPAPAPSPTLAGGMYWKRLLVVVLILVFIILVCIGLLVGGLGWVQHQLEEERLAEEARVAQVERLDDLERQAEEALELEAAREKAAPH